MVPGSMWSALLLIDVPDHFPQFDEKFVRVEQFGHDEAAVKWSLNPPAGEHRGFKQVLNAVDGSVCLLRCGGLYMIGMTHGALSSRRGCGLSIRPRTLNS